MIKLEEVVFDGEISWCILLDQPHTLRHDNVLPDGTIYFIVLTFNMDY